MISPEKPEPSRNPPRDQPMIAASRKVEEPKKRNEQSDAEKGVDSAHDFMAKFLKKQESED